MDHIPTPLKPTHEHIRVPFVVKDAHKYVGVNFFDFPERIGFGITQHLPNMATSQSIDGSIIKSINSPDPVSFEDAASLVQSYFYYGLLQFIAFLTGAPFESDLFITEDETGCQYVSSKYQEAFFDLVFQRVDPQRPGIPEEECARRLELVNILQNLSAIVRDFIKVCDDRGLAVFHHTELQNEADVFIASSIMLSIMCMGEQLSALVNLHGYFSMPPFRPSKLLRDRLADSGWCPHAIANAERRFPFATVLYYLSRMRHGTADQDHSKCTPDVCQRSNLDESTYEQQHAPECIRDECSEHVSEDYRVQTPETRGVSNLLRAGLLPKVALYTNGISSATERTSYRYVAISHVWSDGLGNPHRNSLHTCQLARLQRMVNDLYPGEPWPIPFWLDTLCVPLEPECRKLAISQMKDVYEKADKVLVLDSTLYDASYDMDIYETIMRIATSTWGTRLWTLQEAMFQPNTYYALALKPWTIQELRGVSYIAHLNKFRNPNDSEATLWNTQTQKRASLNLVRSCGLQGVESQGYLSSVPLEGWPDLRDGENVISRIQLALNTRSTSHIEDEPICIASLLGRSPRELFQIKDGGARMKHVMGWLSKAPISFLFSQRPRIKDYGCRWMPRSLLWNQESISSLGNNSRQATVDQDGMLISMPGIRFPGGINPSADKPHTVTIELPGGTIDGQPFQSAVYEISIIYPKPESMKNPQEPWRPCLGKDVAIVMSDLPGKDWHNRRACILVTVRELDEDFVIRRMDTDPEWDTRLFARYEACVTVKTVLNKLSAPSYGLGDSRYELLTEDQEWCIG